MTNELAPVSLGAEERALLTGDLAKLNQDQRANLYQSVCRSLGLNPLTRPFEYLTLNGKLVFYAKKDCADQLRSIHGISVRVGKPEIIADVLYVTAHASAASGRTDEDLGAVFVGGLRGEALANAHMKAITKAKRRVTLSIAGLGMLDENEVDSIPGAVRVEEYTPPQLNRQNTNEQTGELAGKASPADSDPAPAKWLRTLQDLSNELYALDDSADSVAIPETLTVAEAKTLKANLQRAIDETRQALASTDASLEAIGV